MEKELTDEVLGMLKSEGHITNLEFEASGDGEEKADEKDAKGDKEADKDQKDAKGEEDGEEANKDQKDAKGEEDGEEEDEEEDEEADKDQKDEEDKSDDKDDAEEKPSKVQKRIDELVGQREREREKREAAEQRIEELENQLETAQAEHTQASLKMHKALLATTEAEITKYEDECEQFEEWAKHAIREARKDLDHMYRSKDKSGTEREFSSEEIQDRLDDVRAERNRIVPKARALLEKRQAATKEARKDFPRLFERSSADYLEAQRLLLEVPGLKAMPNGMILVGQILAGRKAIKAAKTKPPSKTPPKQPTDGAPASKTPSAGDKKNKDFDAKAFQAAGGTFEALEAQALNIL